MPHGHIRQELFSLVFTKFSYCILWTGKESFYLAKNKQRTEGGGISFLEPRYFPVPGETSHILIRIQWLMQGSRGQDLNPQSLNH